MMKVSPQSQLISLNDGYCLLETPITSSLMWECDAMLFTEN